jgi:hypothetical protein
MSVFFFSFFVAAYIGEFTDETKAEARTGDEPRFEKKFRTTTLIRVLVFENT